MELKDNRQKDLFYSAVMLNTDINYKTFIDLIDNKAIETYRDIADIELLKEIAKGEIKLKPDTVVKIKKLIDSYSDIVKIVNKYEKIASANNIRVVSALDDKYPYNWKVQSGMPKVFYTKGNIDLIEKMTFQGAVSVVGSRNPSKYSLYATDQICRDLGNKGITIVSGMACGIDRQAHISSVNMIGTNGLLISEMPPGQMPLRQYFPSRNRLIAGLSDTPLIMEAGVCSGTLHTASFAAIQGKEVFVLPNNIYYENAKGGLKLLEDGGNVLLGPESVIDSVTRALMFKRMGMGSPAEISFKDDKDDFAGNIDIEALRELAKVSPEALTDDDWKVLITDALTLKSLCADELCSVTMLPFYKISILLTELELNGTVCQEKGKYSLTFV